MRLLVTGGRDFSAHDLLFTTLDRLHAEHHLTLLIHGDARGADRLANEWAQDRGIDVLACPADRKRYGRGAGPKRNRQMLAEKPDIVVAFPGGSGTSHMLIIAEEAGVKVIKAEDVKAPASGDDEQA